MAQANVVPDSYSHQPPSYEECMGHQPPRYPQSTGLIGGLHPPAPQHTYTTNTGLSDYERAKRDKKKRILTIGIIMTLCTVFLVLILYIKINLYHEVQRRHLQHHFNLNNNDNPSWYSKVPERETYHHEYSPRIDIPRVSQQEMDDIHQQLRKFFNTVYSEDKSTELNSETETEPYELINESTTDGLVDGASDY